MKKCFRTIVVGDIPFLLVTNPSLPVRTTRELIALAKARPGEINYVKESFGRQGAEIHFAGPEQVAAIMKTDLAKWAKVARDMNIRVQ